jgi:hypothetical protein
MSDLEKGEIRKEKLDPNEKTRATRAALNALGSSIPFVGGLINAGMSYWSEKEAEEITNILRQWVQMLEDELREKGKTIAEIVARIDTQDERIKERIESPEYQSLLKKAFRNWPSIDTEYKRQRVRNILTNAAESDISSDDVVRLFLDWINLYTDFHFHVIGSIYNNEGITRRQIWDSLGKPQVREDSADADLFKLLIRDLSTGGVIRQSRPTDHTGRFIRKSPSRRSAPSGAPQVTKSAFDDTEPYELTELGRQFVHYAMTEITAKLEFQEHPDQATTSADA